MPNHGKSQRHTLWLKSIHAKMPCRRGLSRARLYQSVSIPRAIVRTFRRYSFRSEVVRGTEHVAE